MSNIIFSFNAVAPVFLLVAVGWLARKIHLLNEDFVSGASKLNFRTGLPALLFLSIYQANGTDTFDGRFTAFMSAGIFFYAVILYLVIPRFIKEKSKASAIIQTAFKSNIIVLGLPLMVMTLGEEHVAACSMLMPFLIPVNNITSVLVLCALDPENSQNSGMNALKKVFINIIKNPLILAAVFSICLKQLSVPLPDFLLKMLTNLSNMATPLALITLGAQMTMKSLISNRKYVVVGTALKVIVMPLLLVSFAYFVGFRSYELATAFILSASPSAVNCYMLAREMHSDEVLTGEILLSDTLFSMFILFTGIFVLKDFSVIP